MNKGPRLMIYGSQLLAVGFCCLLPGLHLADGGEGVPGSTKVVAMLWVKEFFVEDENQALLPRLVVYRNGEVFFVERGLEHEWKPRKSRLPRAEIERISSAITASRMFFELEDSYDLDPCLVDSPRVRVYLSDGVHEKNITVKGLGMEEEQMIGHLAPCGNPKMDDLPAEISRVLRLLGGIAIPPGTDWAPNLWIRP